MSEQVLVSMLFVFLMSTFIGLEVIKNVSRMHPRLEGCLRVTVGTAAENQTFIKALRAVIGTPQ